MLALEYVGIFDFSCDDDYNGAMADVNNLDTTIQVSPTPTTRIYKDHPLDQVIGDLLSYTNKKDVNEFRGTWVYPRSSHDDGFKHSSDDGKKVDEDQRKESKCKDQEKEDNVNNTKNVNTVSLTVNAAGSNEVNADGGIISNELPFDPNMLALEYVGIFDFSCDDDYNGAMADVNNLDTTIQVSPTPTTRIYKDHPLDQVIGDLLSYTNKKDVNEFRGTWVC
nr:hypothetical protein [Tanacetum cinerariifolium]